MTAQEKWIEELYLRIGNPLFLYFQSQKHAPHVAEDLLQETFFRAIKNTFALSKAKSPEAYIFGIARHVSHEVYRKRRSTVSFDDNQILETGVETAQLQDIKALITQLPDIYRETLELRIGKDLSYKEIAEALDIPVGTVRSRLFYALHTLRKLIAPEIKE